MSSASIVGNETDPTESIPLRVFPQSTEPLRDIEAQMQEETEELLSRHRDSSSNLGNRNDDEMLVLDGEEMANGSADEDAITLHRGKPKETLGNDTSVSVINEQKVRNNQEAFKSSDASLARSAYHEKIWYFVNKENESKYNVTNECSTIEFLGRAEAENRCIQGCFPCARNKPTKLSSLMQLSKDIGTTPDPICFTVKIGNLGKNRVGNGGNGIEIGFAKIMQDGKSDRSERMINGIWYDPFNGGIYNNQTIPEEYTNKAAQNDVVEWRVKDYKGKDGEVKHQFTLYLNNEKMGKSIMVTKNVSLYPSINIASTNAKVTINVSGMGYSACPIDYPKNEAEGSSCSCCSCKIQWLGHVIHYIAEATVLWAIVRLLTNCWMIGDILSDAFTTAKYYQEDEFLFIPAVIIWFLTPLNYSRVIFKNLFLMFFATDEYNRESLVGKRWSTMFLSAFCLSPEKVNSIHVYLKVMILCLPPFSIVFMMMIFGYSIFLAYILFPFFAIKTAIHDVYIAVLKSCESKFQIAEEKCNGIFCGMRFMRGEDILTMKSYEVFYEAFPQATLAIIFFVKGYCDEDCAWALVSICMNIGSIFFTSVVYYVHSGKLLYGSDIFKRPGSAIKIIWGTHYICCISVICIGIFAGAMMGVGYLFILILLPSDGSVPFN